MKQTKKDYGFLQYKWVDKEVIKIPFNCTPDSSSRDIKHSVFYLNRALESLRQDPFSTSMSFNRDNTSGLLLLREKNLELNVLGDSDYGKFQLLEVPENVIKIKHSTLSINLAYVSKIILNLVKELPSIVVDKKTSRFS